MLSFLLVVFRFFLMEFQLVFIHENGVGVSLILIVAPDYGLSKVFWNMSIWSEVGQHDRST